MEEVTSSLQSVQDSILQKVAEMLTDNIYDLIPSYAELTDTVHTVIKSRLDALEAAFGEQKQQQFQSQLNQIVALKFEVEKCKL